MSAMQPAISTCERKTSSANKLGYMPMNGVPLDEGMAAFNRILSESAPAGSESWPVERQRQSWDDLCRKFRAPRPVGLVVSEENANGVPVRLFRPDTGRKVPVVIYAHGGGWVLGSPETHDDICAEMASGAGCAVALMNYRKAPEHPFPAQLEDSLKVWRWFKSNAAHHNINAQSMVAAGDSCGGQMSVALALALRDLNLEMPSGLVLIYPVLGADFSTASYIRNANGSNLTRAEMDYYLTSFLGPRGGPLWSDPKALPNLADVAGLPPVSLTAAAHDPLHDDAVIFRQKLEAAGIPVAFRSEPALSHSYMRARHHSAPAMAGFRWIVDEIRRHAHSR
jgi:acetyl esterase